MVAQRLNIKPNLAGRILNYQLNTMIRIGKDICFRGRPARDV